MCWVRMPAPCCGDWKRNRSAPEELRGYLITSRNYFATSGLEPGKELMVQTVFFNKVGLFQTLVNILAGFITIRFIQWLQAH